MISPISNRYATRLGNWAFSVILVACFGCAAEPVARSDQADPADLAVPWVRTSVEYKAAALQTYQIASSALETLVADRAWSALPEQTDAANLPPAVILDVDETVLDNSLYQERHGNQYAPDTWDLWLAERAAVAVPGVVDFLHRARALGIETFFVTNRPCRSRAGDPSPCPQEQDTLINMAQLGIETDPGHLLLLDERPQWGREKLTRRRDLSDQYRIVMQIGDQLGDFLPCARRSIETPCTQGATSASRLELYRQHGAYWGNGWYMLPNPMYGSWTGFH